MKKLLPFLLLLLTTYQLKAQLLTTEGSTFWLGFMENHEQTTIDLEVHITAKETITARISVPGTDWNRSFFVFANSTTRLAIPTNIAMARNSENIEPKGVLVEILDGKKANVFALNNRFRSADATVVLPIESLGKSYYVMAHAEQDGLSRFSQLLIVAPEDSTEIEITPSVRTRGGKPAGEPFTIVLNKSDVYQIQAGLDLTGTRVRSIGDNTAACKNFAVFGGNEWTRVGECGNAPDHLYEQMYPVNTWGKEFIIVPYRARSGGDIVKILASEDNTTVLRNGINPTVLNAGEFVQFLSNSVLSIESDKPISVAQLTRSQNCDNSLGDPFMIMVSPNQQRLESITFNALAVSSITNYYLNVIIKTEDVETFILDRETIPDQFLQVPNTPEFSFARVEIDRGNHRIEADSGFIAYVYGFGVIESFGYVTGTSLRPLDLVAQAVRQDGTVSSDTLQVCKGEDFDLNADAEDIFQFFNWNIEDSISLQGQRVTTQLLDTGIFRIELTGSTVNGDCATEAKREVWIQVSEPDILEITGLLDFCKSSIDTTQYMLETHAADSLIWSVTGGTIVGGQFTDTLSVLWNVGNLRAPSNASVSVTPFNETGCNGQTTSIDISLNPLQEIATPTGTDSLCYRNISIPLEYTTQEIENLNFLWNVDGGQIIGGQGTPTISVVWSEPTNPLQPYEGKLWLEGYEEASQFCFEGSDTLTVKILPPPDTTLNLMVVQDSLCPTEILMASVSADSSFINFKWTLPDGTTVQGKELSYPFNEPGKFTVNVEAETFQGVCFTTIDTSFQVEVFSLEVELDGSPSVCPDVTDISYVAKGDSILSYQWDVFGGVIQTGQGTDSITVNWGDTNLEAYVQAYPIAPTGCQGDTIRFPVRVNQLLEPETPIGSTLLCQDAADSIVYNVGRPTEGSSYQWFVEGGEVVEGQGSAAAKISWSGFGSRKIWLEESNVADTLCNGFSDTLFVEILPTPTDTLKAVPDRVQACAGEFFQWQITEADTAYKFFDWDLGDGTTLMALPKDSTIIHAYENPGQYIVTLNAYTGGTCLKVATFKDTVNVPIPTAELSGDLFICEGEAPQTYQVVQPNADNTYHWLVDGGTITEVDSVNSQVSIQWELARKDAMVKVVPQNSLGCFGDTVKLTVRINPILETETPTGETNLCLSESGNVLYQVPETFGYAYQWQVEGGEILEGNGTAQITVKWDGAGEGTVSLAASNVVDTLCFGPSEKLNVRIKPNLSAQLELVTVSHSLTKNDTLEVSWIADQVVADTLIFSLERRRVYPDTSAYQTISLPFNWTRAQTNYAIEDPVPNSAEEIYQYRLTGVSECNEVVEAPLQQSVLIFSVVADEPEEEIELEWSEFKGWMNGVQTYDIFRQTENETEAERIDSRNAQFLLTTETRAGFDHCYRVLAVEQSGNGAIAWSNEVCIVLQHDITIANVFTPNGDGFNDTFFVIKLEMYPDNIFRVYNRWGEEVFYQEGYQNDWDGKANGKEVRAGTYFFELQLRSERANLPVIKGPVTILR